MTKQEKWLEKKFAVFILFWRNLIALADFSQNLMRAFETEFLKFNGGNGEVGGNKTGEQREEK